MAQHIRHACLLCTILSAYLKCGQGLSSSRLSLAALGNLYIFLPLMRWCSFRMAAFADQTKNTMLLYVLAGFSHAILVSFFKDISKVARLVFWLLHLYADQQSFISLLQTILDALCHTVLTTQVTRACHYLPISLHSGHTHAKILCPLLWGSESGNRSRITHWDQEVNAKVVSEISRNPPSPELPQALLVLKDTRVLCNTWSSVLPFSQELPVCCLTHTRDRSKGQYFFFFTCHSSAYQRKDAQWQNTVTLL